MASEYVSYIAKRLREILTTSFIDSDETPHQRKYTTNKCFNEVTVRGFVLFFVLNV